MISDEITRLRELVALAERANNDGDWWDVAQVMFHIVRTAAAVNRQAWKAERERK